LKENVKKTLLTFNGTYLPGYKAGGPIRSIANMTEQLREEYFFLIVTLDRDFGDKVPYENIKVDQWNKVRNEDVFYHSPEKKSLLNLMSIIKSKKYDLVYLNGFFSEYTIKYLMLRKLRLIPTVPIIILPRGDLSSGALSIKRFKKNLFIKLVKTMGIYNNLVWQATSESEKNDIFSVFRNQTKSVSIIGNLASSISIDHLKRVPKEQGLIKVIFLSRITEVKNLKFALEILKNIKGRVEFNIFGPVSDIEYWEECKGIIRELPTNITVNYKGSLSHNEVPKAMIENHLFLLPTYGENFGHVIVEALSTGCPVLISNRTPWNNLELQKVGWDIPLTMKDKFNEKLQFFVDMNEKEYQIYSDNASKLGASIISDDGESNKSKLRKLLTDTLGN
jgi:glycosyltransferase involved in cell wall biosynthesis